ncbi:MFS general substrate transporter [Sistotremastrum suecicum HHB10207 ss-3]|uniref:MFS general substrate transporter n=1 Tax=Sistotremastrum suecicum HHB10207 ss-3 TaxID=1314776 RepID=A0A166A9B7_9AGAM|nr:MFS general substrate transporter [Sistotremastrum suecicum HHB10207 ss-3]
MSTVVPSTPKLHGSAHDSSSSLEKIDALEATLGATSLSASPTDSTAVSGLETEDIRSWWTVLGAFLVQLTTIGHVNAYGVYEAFYKQEYLSNSSSSAISWIGSTQYSLLFALGVVGGVLFDKGKFKPLVYFSTGLYIFSNFMLSLAHPHQFYQIFLSQGLGMGAAMGLLYTPSFMIVGDHFRRRRALAMGVVACGSAIGGLIQPILLNKLFSSSLGFGDSIRCDAAMNSALLIIASITMAPKKARHSQEGEEKKVDVSAFFRELDYMFVIIGGNLVSFGLFFPAVYIQLFSVTKGFPTTFSFYSLAILNAASVFGRIIPNILADRYGLVKVMFVMILGLGAAVFGLLGVKSVAADVVVILVFGFFSGGFSSLQSPIFASMAKSPDEIGARFGIASVIATIPCLIGPPINGALLTNEFIWMRPIVFSGSCTMLGAALFLFILLRRRPTTHGSQDNYVGTINTVPVEKNSSNMSESTAVPTV